MLVIIMLANLDDNIATSPSSSSATIVAVTTVTVVVIVIVMVAILILLTVCQLRGRKGRKVCFHSLFMDRRSSKETEEGLDMQSKGSVSSPTPLVDHIEEGLHRMRRGSCDSVSSSLVSGDSDLPNSGSCQSNFPLLPEESKVEAVRGPRPPPSLDQRVEYEDIDLKATKVS